MKLPPMTRRQFFGRAFLAISGAAAADALAVEPTWLQVRHLRVGKGPVAHRLVHFSDVHHKGDEAYLRSVVNTINSLQPDFVCFTGDIVERSEHLPAALDILSGVKSPMFGVPGNHEFYSGISFKPVRECFAATGGAWLMNSSQQIAGRDVNLIGSICLFPQLRPLAALPQCKNIFLTHYPERAKQLDGRTFDLLLAGHSHGGQVRLPLWGSIIVPSHVGQYDLGLFQTPAGPLHVNPGIGYLGHFDVRFNCRPEITVIEI
jgi:hypothetical protein